MANDLHVGWGRVRIVVRSSGRATKTKILGRSFPYMVKDDYELFDFD
jgi:hypothetical protein